MKAGNGFLNWPRFSLALIFVTWKSLLFGIALCSPGPGYDTSTTIVQPLDRWSIPFVRWDAIYYTQVARRGYLFEQDWAFGWGFTRLIKVVVTYIQSNLNKESELIEAWVGITISHLGHFVAVQALYSASLKLFRRTPGGKDIAFTTACLHVVSPAGIFLSAPCPEAIFAALQFLGYDAYIEAWSPSRPFFAARCLQLSIAGLCFGIAMLTRSNGLLSGILFAYDAVILGLRVASSRRSWQTFFLLAATVAAGSCIALGAALPQFLAYQEYCHANLDRAALRPWCSRRIPSIYSFVQVHYWNNGFLRYWTLSNLPLFMLATPVLWMMAQSSYWAWTTSLGNLSQAKGKPVHADGTENTKEPITILRLIAVPQGVLMIATLLNSHVQIITRIASGYPVWYMWLAFAGAGHLGARSRCIAQYSTRGMIIYAMIQGVLYASFLPPA